MNSCINFWILNSLSRHYIVPIKGSYIHTFKFSKSKNYELFVLTCDAKVKVFYLEKQKAVQIREIVNTHESFISDLAFIGFSSFIATVGGDKTVHVWDYWMRVKRGPEARQQFTGHACPIYTIVSSKNGRIYTAGGSEGIFCWKFLGDTSADLAPQGAWGTVEVVDSDKHLKNFDPILEESSTPAPTLNHIQAGKPEKRLDSIHIPGLKEESKFNVQMDVVRGNRDMEDLHEFENKNNLERIKKRLADEEARKNKQIRGLLEQGGKFTFKKQHGFVPSRFEKLIPYVKNYEREKLDLPQKHFYMDHHEYDVLTHRVDRLSS